jgi:DNA-binding transcriptional MerR regulator
MGTETLVADLLGVDGDSSRSVIDAIHTLFDESTLEALGPALGIGEAAALLGLSPHTLRYYEDRGLVRPVRNTSGYREYRAADLRRLVFLTRMRLSGMTMQDLARYVALAERGQETAQERRAIMTEQRERIKRQMRELELALLTTEYKISVYGGHPEG